MHTLSLEIDSAEELWELIDKRFDSIFIHAFLPNETLEWWSIDLKMHTGLEMEHLSVRQLKMDVQTDLKGLRKLLTLNNRYLRIFQFDRPLPDTLVLEQLPEQALYQVLRQNGLQHYFLLSFEYLSIGSVDEEFITQIRMHPTFVKRIAEGG